MDISQNEVERIAILARINLSEKEKEKMAEDLDQILGYIEKLNQVDTSNIEPTAQVTGLEDVTRNDKPGGDTDRNKIIEQFPHKKEDFLKVKAVFEYEE
jgi:aspartyl-tRNA(Asn)/glutamyl-tRNA(Gln) amidotransferase subunit C